MIIILFLIIIFKYILIDKNFKDRVFKLKRYIYDEKVASSFIPINDRFTVEYINEENSELKSNDLQIAETLYFMSNVNKQQLNAQDSLGNSLDSNQIHGIGLYSTWS